MRVFRIAFIFSLTLMILAGCSKEEIQPDPLNSADDIALKGAKVKDNAGSDPWHTSQNKYISFEGKFSDIQIVYPLIQEPPPFPKIQEVTGSGEVEAFGDMQLFMKQEWTPEVIPPPTWDFLGFGIGEMVFTDDDGDELYAYYTDAVAEHPYMKPVIITWNARFDGGTGKFVRAKGKFQWNGVFTKMGGEATATGTIKY